MQIQVQSQQQIQTLSPQQILLVKLLELPEVEFEERVRAELQDNPALEATTPETEEAHEAATAESDVLADYRTEEDIPDYYQPRATNGSSTQHAEEIPFSEATSFYEKLKEQLREQKLTDHEKKLAEYLIGSLDDDGLLRKSLDDLSNELAIYMDIEASPKELHSVLQKLQRLEPTGIAAQSLQECLLLQIKARPTSLLTADEARLKEAEIKTLTRYYELFTRKHWDRLQHNLQLNEEDFHQVISDLTHLNPRPGNALGEVLGKSSQLVVPDFLLEFDEEGELILSLNDYNIPMLFLNNDFRLLLKEHEDKSTLSASEKAAFSFTKQKIDAAQGFIEAIKQRQQTLLRTMKAIIELQRPFFEEGEEALLKPMILKDIAEITDLDISTISRVSNSKWIQTPFGIYRLRHFFGDGFTMQSGEEISSREIRRILSEVIEAEDKLKPLTDDKLCEILTAKGYPIARRTVAKYRMQLGLPVARMRRN
ncbi:MAG: RNA polymerase factor sigma-54 [Bacteroidaceae bacterium]